MFIHTHKLNTYSVYLIYSGATSLSFSLIFTDNLVYQVETARLNPLRLVLVGTVLEFVAFVCQVPTGVLTDIYSRRLAVIPGIFLFGSAFVTDPGVIEACKVLRCLLYSCYFPGWNIEIIRNTQGEMDLKVLVTGAAGFLGGHLVDMLLERGYEVRAMVRSVEDASRLRKLDGVEVVLGDLVDRESLKKAVQGVLRVFNVAARTGPWGLEKDYKAVNVWGVADLITASMDAGVQRIVHTSSITVYGHHLKGIITEDHPFHAEDNPYSRTKIAGEKLIGDFVTERGAPVVIVRPAWIYGPRDTASFGRFVAMVDSGKGFLIGSGKNIVPIVYVRDVAQGLIKAGEASDASIGKAYTIADDRRVTQAEYLNTIADFLGVSPVTRKIPYLPLLTAGRGAELVWRAMGRLNAAPPPVTTYGVTLLGGNQEFSIEKARRELGYDPKYDLMRGVYEGVNWYVQAVKGSLKEQTEREIVQAKS